MFNRFRVSIWDDEKVLEMGSGDGCPTVKTYLMPLNYTLNIVQVAIFYVMYILPQLFFFKVLLHGRMGHREKRKTVFLNYRLKSRDAFTPAPSPSALGPDLELKEGQLPLSSRLWGSGKEEMGT